MLFGKFTPMEENQVLESPKDDYRSAAKFGGFRLSDRALYRPDGSYLLRSNIAQVSSGVVPVHVTGCCAGGVPTPRVVVTTQSGGKFQFLCDSKSIAQRLTAALTEGCPTN